MSDLIELGAVAYRCRNSGAMRGFIFSLRKRKFVKGKITKVGVEYRIRYRLYPGRYLRFTWEGRSRCDPVDKVVVELIHVRKDGIKVLASAMWRLEVEEAIREENGFRYIVERYCLDGVPTIVVRFFESRPGYHGPPGIPNSVVYGKDEVEEVLRALRPGGIVYNTCSKG